MTTAQTHTSYQAIQEELAKSPKTWLVTGCAGFIGSNLVEALIKLNQKVIGLDNLSTGKRNNLEDIRERELEKYKLFHFFEGDVTDPNDGAKVCQGVDIILHQAALGSVPRSIENPLNTHHNNVTGQLMMLEMARRYGVKRVVYASSSSVYGDHPGLPKVEEKIGRQLSPYAVTKYANELYAQVFSAQYHMEIVGLRYFNVFGRRQDPFGAYAAVIPLWVKSMFKGENVFINGDGETSRDFCYVENVVQANILAGVSPMRLGESAVYNVACGEQTTLNQLHSLLATGLKRLRPELSIAGPQYRAERPGDVRHSLASIEKISHSLGYHPSFKIHQGLNLALQWYVENLSP